jgi:hypothetical protein
MTLEELKQFTINHRYYKYDDGTITGHVLGFWEGISDKPYILLSYTNVKKYDSYPSFYFTSGRIGFVRPKPDRASYMWVEAEAQFLQPRERSQGEKYVQGLLDEADPKLLYGCHVGNRVALTTHELEAGNFYHPKDSPNTFLFKGRDYKIKDKIIEDRVIIDIDDTLRKSLPHWMESKIIRKGHVDYSENISMRAKQACVFSDNLSGEGTVGIYHSCDNKISHLMYISETQTKSFKYCKPLSDLYEIGTTFSRRGEKGMELQYFKK